MRSFRSKAWRVLFAALALALVAGACGGGDDDDENGSGGSGGGDLSGSVSVSGSSTVEPISSLVAEKFQGENPDVQISVDGPGTGDGFELFCNGETDVSDASRPIKLDEEAPICEENGIEFIEIKVAIDGIAVLTSLANEIECVTFADLYALTGPESQGFENWSDANELAAELGGAGDLPEVPLDLTAPGEESGTYDYWVEAIIEGPAEERKLPEEEWTMRADYQSSPNDNVIIEGVTGSDSSLGYVGYAFFVQNEGAVKALEVDGGDGCVAPTPETIESAEYPISRFLYIYVNAAKAEENEALSAYIDYYVGEEGIVSAEEVGYVALPDEDLQVSIDAWEARETGSREEG